MLSRSANCLYWMGRYLERAENLARLVDVNSQFLLEIESAPGFGEDDGWLPILEVAHLDELFEARRKLSSALSPLEFLCLSPANPDSICGCIAQARENARMVRDQVSEEMWRELNRLHLFLRSDLARDEWHYDLQDFCERIINFSLLFQGITDSTIGHDEGWRFIQLGKYLERADKTTRILDIPHHLSGHLKAAPWPTVLRACSARSAFLAAHGATTSKEKTASLLLFSDSFPRSVRFCLNKVDETLHGISGSPRGMHTNEAERLAGSALASVDFNGPQDLATLGLHAYADRLQTEFNAIGKQIFENYVLLPSEIKHAPPPLFHTMQQAQQVQQ